MADVSDGLVDRQAATFVGRRAEMSTLATLFERVRRGTPVRVCIDGPAGIGKTALVRRFLRSASDVGVLEASGEESEQGLPFGVVEQLLGAADGLHDTDQATEGRAIVDMSADPLVAGAALVEVIRGLERTRAVLVVVDDAHWADRLSLIALTFALRRLVADQVMAIVVTRDVADGHLPSGLARLLTCEETVRLTLAGLSAGDLRSLSTRLGGGPLSLRAADRLEQHTAGNPLHARTLLEQLPAIAFADAHAPLPAPRSYELLVVGKLMACRPEAVNLVSAASVLGQRCPLHAAAALADLDDPLPALDDACRGGLLAEHRATRTVELPRPLVVEFPHPLIHAAVYQHIGAAARNALHQRAAVLTEDVTQRRHHRVLAATCADPELADELADNGRQAMRVGQWSTASDQLMAAARLCPERVAGEELWLEAIDCQLMSGDSPDFETVSARLRSFADTSRRSYLLARLALADGRLDEAEAFLGEAWTRLDMTTETLLGARIADQLAWLFVARGQGSTAAAWSDRAVALAGPHNTTDVSRLIRLVALGMSGRGASALASLGDLPEPAAASVGDLDGLLGRGRLRSWNDDLQGACRDLTGVLAAAQGRSITFEVIASAVLGEVEYGMGRWDESVLHSSTAASLAVDAEQGWLVSICHAIIALVAAARGQWDQAMANVEAGAERIMHPGHVTATLYVTSARAHLAAARNDPDEVITILHPVRAQADADLLSEPGVIMRWQDLLADALIAVGRCEEAEVVLDQFEACATERRHCSSMAAAARVRATLLSARHNTAAATAEFGRAHELAEHVDVPFDQARLELAHGETLRRAGKRSMAADRLDAALCIFDRLGAAPYLARAEREMAACGAGSSHRPLSGRDSLTPQELAVANLVAQGLSNRQVARELVISVKTVEYHLGHVYAKMHLASRVQLSRRMTET